MCYITVNRNEKIWSVGWHCNKECYRNVPDKYRNMNTEKSNLKKYRIWSDKLEAPEWQTGGAAKSALASFWIDLRKVWQSKSWPWDTAESKKVWIYGVTMQIEGSRSLWRKIIRSGGIRSSNWLSGQLENLTRRDATLSPGDRNHS